jgi:hypothetical protein
LPQAGWVPQRQAPAAQLSALLRLQPVQIAPFVPQALTLGALQLPVAQQPVGQF